jgi:monofunctional biosynthetic peptidoglycan transglycosylase
VTAYFLFLNQVTKLKDHYPVFNKKLNHYELVAKKPKHWLGLKKVSKHARYAIMVSEDWAFYEHEGFDLNQIKIVLRDSLKERKLVRGASTITQQVVKNALLSNERSLTRKLKEFLLAREIEKVLTKDEILEIYLNLIELGDGVYGIHAGSYHYFKKHPSKLSAKEGAFLAMLLPSPKKYAQSFKNKILTKFATEQVANILVKLRQAKIITEKERLQLSYKKLNFEKVNAKDLLNIKPIGKKSYKFKSINSKVLGDKEIGAEEIGFPEFDSVIGD